MSVSYDASWEEWNHFILPAQRTVKIECGPDQREVCKGLREGYSVPHRKLCFVPRKISETIGIPPQPLKQELGLRSSFSGCVAVTGRASTSQKEHMLKCLSPAVT